ncbi:MAG: DEAD/DEAH box helicase family protein [Candidatus Eisenbacteria bacterium]|nr:DEAD/DEAH box helicase family protein [Candidatus Eisenbacteria bacterium]
MITAGRIIVRGSRVTRGPQKRPDYLLRYRRDHPIAIVEAKAEHRLPADGLQQAKDYARTIGVPFAYSTNGRGIVEFDFLTGVERTLDAYPSPEDLWQRHCRAQGLDDPVRVEQVLTPGFRSGDWEPRYYQEIAINRAVQAILQGRRRVLLTMATGTGKTAVAFQVCWRLWNARWNRSGQARRPRMLYLADRNILVDDPKDKTFAPLGDARWKIQGRAVKSREMYFATYQAIARDERRPGLYRAYAPDFFDLVIVDECHRGSAADESNWREILEYFEPAYQLGMTATPLCEDNRNTYEYFGNPIYSYSLRQGIEDGFLAPYRVHRIVTEVDATGYRPAAGERDLRGREIPDQTYETPDFERTLSHAGRTRAIARHLTNYLAQTDRSAKTIVFCVDQDHAEAMRSAIARLNADLMRVHHDYVCRVVSDEGAVGRGHLSDFQDVESESPVILTTSQMLSTGVDAPMVKNVALARTVNSMTEFKQIIGRGTRVRDDYGKYYFTILDYTGSATRHFADPEFDGQPALITEERVDGEGHRTGAPIEETPEQEGEDREEVVIETGVPQIPQDEAAAPRRKYYVDGGAVEIAASVVYELDPQGGVLRVVRLTDYTQQKVRELFPTAAALRDKWSRADERQAVIEALEQRGVDLDHLREATHQPDADPFDLLCHVVYSAPIRTRRERADRLRKEHREFFERFAPEAREILQEVLEKYADHGVAQLTDPKILQVEPLSRHGNLLEIAGRFGGPTRLRDALEELQRLLYAA